MKKRIWLPILAACIFLAACTRQDSTLRQVPGWEAEEEDPAVTLRWYYGMENTVEMAAAVTRDYFAQTGVAIEWISKEACDGIQSLFASGKEPDVFALSSSAVTQWKDRLYALDNRPFVEHAFPNAISQAAVDGALYAMPLTYDACGLIYNKTMFAQAGIDKLPQTVSELEDVCRRLRAAGVQPFGECYQLSGFAGHTLSVLFASQPDLDAALRDLETGELSIAGMAHYQEWIRLFDLMAEYGLGAESCYYNIDDQIADFAEGKMAMIKQGTWLERSLLDANSDLDMGLMAIPSTEHPEDCRLMVTTTDFLGVNRNSPHIEEALDFLDWLYQNMEHYIVDLDGSTVCYDNVTKQTLAALNADAEAYISQNTAYMRFGNEEWPVDYESDVMEVFRRYLTGIIGRDAVAGELTTAYQVRAGNY